MFFTILWYRVTIIWYVLSLLLLILQDHSAFHPNQTAQGRRFDIVLDPCLCVQGMVHVLAQQRDEFLVDELVQYFTVHDPSSDNNDLRGNGQGDVEAKLGQIVPQNPPDLLLVWHFMQPGEVHIQPLSDRLVAHHPLKARLVEWTDPHEFLVLL